MCNTRLENIGEWSVWTEHSERGFNVFLIKREPTVYTCYLFVYVVLLVLLVIEAYKAFEPASMRVQTDGGGSGRGLSGFSIKANKLISYIICYIFQIFRTIFCKAKKVL